MDVHAGNKKAIVITPRQYMVHMRVRVISYHLTAQEILTNSRKALEECMIAILCQDKIV